MAPPEEIFDRPATAYVADFIGSSNFWDGRAEGGRIALPDGQHLTTALDGAVRIMARPHNLRLTPGRAGPWRGTVRFQRSIGALVEYEVATGAGDIRVLAIRAERASALTEGAEVTLAVIDPAFLSVYPAP